MTHSDQLKQLAVQLASLASPEVVVTHGIQSLLDPPPGLVVPDRALPVSLPRPRSRSRSRIPKAAPPSWSILLSERVPLAWRSRAAVPEESAGATSSVRVSLARLAARLLAPPERPLPSRLVAAETERRSRDNWHASERSCGVLKISAPGEILDTRDGNAGTLAE